MLRNKTPIILLPPTNSSTWRHEEGDMYSVTYLQLYTTLLLRCYSEMLEEQIPLLLRSQDRHFLLVKEEPSGWVSVRINRDCNFDYSY